MGQVSSCSGLWCRVGPRAGLLTRRGFSTRGLIVAMLLVLAIPAIAWSVLPRWPWSSRDHGGPMMYRVERAKFIHDVTERGDVESASNIEIASKVESSGSAGVPILSIVPEGTVIEPEDALPDGCVVTYKDLVALEKLRRGEQVEQVAISSNGPGSEPGPDPPGTGAAEPGSPDGGEAAPEAKPNQSEGSQSEPIRLPPEELLTKMILVKLDSSALENEKIQQEIVVYNSEAAVLQAQNVLDAAEIALEEYRQGQYLLDEQAIQSEILLAEENCRRAEEYYNYSKRMLAKGYITEPQLKADKFAWDKAKNDLESAQNKLKILRTFTRNKMEKQLMADIKTARAKLAAAQASYDLDVEKLNEIKEQIANCTIFARQPGQVVYANREGRRGDDDVIIEEGTLIRERQVIIRLPDPKRMQVEAKINEAKVKLVETGMEATIELDAFPGQELEGVVDDVAQLPVPTGWWIGNVKEYETIIKILDPEQVDLRPGYTAKVAIRVEELDDVLQVPVQAIIEHGSRHYCVLRHEDQFVPHEVTIGSSNDKFVVIEGGLEEGDEVVHNAAAYREELDLPELAPKAAPQRGPAKPAERFNQLDRNGDGQLQASELPAPARPHVSAADTDGNGSLSRAEFRAAAARLRADGARAGPSGGARKARQPGTPP